MKKSKASPKPKTKASSKKVSATKSKSTVKSKERVGILGGAFNPVHIGHLNSALTVREKLKLDKVLLIPSFKAPHREITGLKPEERVELIEAAIKPYRPELELSTLEMDREGISYSVDTLKALGRTYKKENMYFIMGSDAFQNFNQWKDYVELLKLANFVVTTRPGTFLSLAPHDLPQGMGALVKSQKADRLVMKSGREIIKVDLEDIHVSATDIRKKLRNNQKTEHLLPPAVTKIISERGYFKRTSPLVSDYRDFSKFCARRAIDKKAIGVKIYDMTKQSSYADYSVICSATSSRHAASIADNITDIVKDEIGLIPLSVEGQGEGLWVLIDFGAVVIHVFQDHVRDQYKLENMWRDCAQIQGEIKDENPAAKSSGQESRTTRL